MNKALLRRLTTLEEHFTIPDDGYEFFRAERDDEGHVVRYVLLQSGQTLSPADFWDLVDARSKVTFIPLQPGEPDAEAEAYWELTETLSGSWQAFLAENAGGPMAPRPGTWLHDDDARSDHDQSDGDAQASGNSPERVEQARRYAGRLEESDAFWEEMMQRCGRRP